MGQGQVPDLQRTESHEAGLEDEGEVEEGVGKEPFNIVYCFIYK